MILVFGAAQKVDLAAELVGAAAHDARRQGERVRPLPPAAEWQRPLEVAADIDRLHGLLHFEHRRLAAHLNGLGDRPDSHRHIDLNVQLGAHFEAGALELRESRQLADNGVDAWRQVDQPVKSVSVGHGRERRGPRRCGVAVVAVAE